MSMIERMWTDVGPLDAIPERGARVVKSAHGDIAVFRTETGDAFALRDRCPHRGGPLSQGIVHGKAVTCPLHNWVISLETGSAQGADHGQVRTISVRNDNGTLMLELTELRVAAE